jgi:hypothetical protein
VPDALEIFEQVAVGGKRQRALAEFAPADHLGFEIAIEGDSLAGTHLAAGPHQRFPDTAARLHRPHEQDLDLALPAGAMAVQARGKNPRIVQYQAIAGAEKFGQVAKGAVLAAAGSAVDDEHARGGAVRKWLLGDEVFGKVVIEFGEVGGQVPM